MAMVDDAVDAVDLVDPEDSLFFLRDVLLPLLLLRLLLLGAPNRAGLGTPPRLLKTGIEPGIVVVVVVAPNAPCPDAYEAVAPEWSIPPTGILEPDGICIESPVRIVVIPSGRELAGVRPPPDAVAVDVVGLELPSPTPPIIILVVPEDTIFPPPPLPIPPPAVEDDTEDDDRCRLADANVSSCSSNDFRFQLGCRLRVK